MSRQALAVFDLDRTLITSSSATVFRKHLAEHGLGGAHDLPLVDVFTRFYEQFGENWLLMQPARLASRASAGWSTATVEQAMREAADELATLLLPGAAKAIEEHRAAGRLLVIATTSPAPFVEPFAERLGFDATVATQWEREDGPDGEVFTGRMLGPFVWGRSKADAVKQWADEHGVSLSESWAYSDSYFDAPLLANVGHPVVVNPDLQLRIAATIRGMAGHALRSFRRGCEDPRPRAAGMGSPVHAPGDRDAQRPHRVRGSGEHSRHRPGDPGVQPSLVLRPDRDGSGDREDGTQRPRSRQEGGVRRPDRRAPDEGLGRHQGRSWHRVRRAPRRGHRRGRGRRTADDRSRGNDPTRSQPSSIPC